MKKRVLFICVGNSARSLMAEALLRHHGGDAFEVYSAGTNPEPVDPRALQALTHFGIAAEHLYSKSVDEVAGREFDLVITLCDKSRGEYEQAPKIGELIAWDFADPATRECIRPFYTTARELSERIKIFALVQSKDGCRRNRNVV